MTRKTRRTARGRTVRNAANPAVARLEALRASAGKALGTLIDRGTGLREAGRRIALARVGEARRAVLGASGEARVRAADAVSRLEKAFESRVSGVISKLGVPTARDVRALSRQVAHLQQSVDRLRRVRAR